MLSSSVMHTSDSKPTKENEEELAFIVSISIIPVNDGGIPKQ